MTVPADNRNFLPRFSLRRRPCRRCRRSTEAAFRPRADFDIFPGHFLSVAVPSLRCASSRDCLPGTCPPPERQPRSCSMAESPASANRTERKVAALGIGKRFLTALLQALSLGSWKAPPIVRWVDGRRQRDSSHGVRGCAGPPKGDAGKGAGGARETNSIRRAGFRALPARDGGRARPSDPGSRFTLILRPGRVPWRKKLPGLAV
jgi:hypothetical protein